MSHPNTMSDSHVLSAMNTPVDASDWTIDVFTIDEDGNQLQRLPEFVSTITAWDYVLALKPILDLDDEEDDEEEFIMPDDDGEESVSSDDEESDTDPHIFGEPDADEYRELVLTHHMTGAAFQEMNAHVFNQEETPLVSVVVTYFVGKDQERHPIFSHAWFGFLYAKDELSGSRNLSSSQPLLVTTHMNVMGCETYCDPSKPNIMARVIQEYSRGVH